MSADNVLIWIVLAGSSSVLILQAVLSIVEHRRRHSLDARD
jgi:hypothetical protein